MPIQKQSYQIQGMRQDNLVATGASTKFAHEIMNMRLNTIGDYTTASWTTEKGTLLKNIEWTSVPSDALEILSGISGNIIPIGQAVLNDQWIVFATENLDENGTGYDFIFKYWYRYNSDTLLGTILYAGKLGFDGNHPCETLAFYENENVQKVYWTDGKNQPRVINITDNGIKYHTDLDGQFDFVQEVSLRERVDITKKTDGAGLFPPGTVKYAITYYRKYGQETNIVYDSPLYYPIKGDRACSPDELSGDSFEIRVTNIDVTHGFDYIRLYSIVRTTENATPIVRIVADKEIASLPLIPYDSSNPDNGYDPNEPNKRYALFVDTNITGEIVDPTILQYVGGREVIAQTFDQKNNTLFLGNITLKQKSALEALDGISLNDNNAGFVIGDFTAMKAAYNVGGYNYQHFDKFYFAYDNEKAIGIRTNLNNDTAFYQYSNQLTATKHYHSYTEDTVETVREHNGNSQRIKIFKYGEWYRFGIQFQDIKGNWSEVIHLTQSESNGYDFKNNIKPVTDEYSSVGVFGVFSYHLPNAAVQKLLNNNFVKARLVCCYPNNTDRTILAQGVINPTIENAEWKADHSPDVLASWFFRPKDNGTGVTTLPYKDYLKTLDNGNCEIQSMLTTVESDAFSINQNILTLNSSEITFDESIRTLDLDNISLKAVGYVPIQSYAAYTYVEATEPFPAYNGTKGSGLHAPGGIKNFDISSVQPGSHFVNQGEWRDRDYWRTDSGHEKEYPWVLYAFHRKGSLTDYIKDVDPWEVRVKDTGDSDVSEKSYRISSGSILENKCLSHLLYSGSTQFFSTLESINCTNFNIVDTEETIPTKIGSLVYLGNVNSIAPIRDNYINSKQTFKDADNKEQIVCGAYPILLWSNRSAGEFSRYPDDYADPTKRGQIKEFGYTSDPVPITFNSTPHGVFYSDGYNVDNIAGSSLKPYLPIVDVIRQTSDDTRFGGKTAINNIFLPCGPSVDLRECGNCSPTLFGLEGDHYFMRYDCLKTYPKTTEDTNQIVEILSFMTETRVNLDGRYDKNRGLSDNTIVGNHNFNLINKSYTQSNNFFTYTTLDVDDSVLDKFGNQFTWTKDKVSGEYVDTWTNITMASIADAEGICGNISKIINVNDALYIFQEHGIANIGYNEKTALSTEAGIPLEIANSGKYSGLKYLTKEVGCQNKWSISKSKNGCFFIDDSRQELLALNPELTSLSTVNGFDAFLIQQLPDSEHFTPWTPYEPKNFVSYYDKLGNDIYYINKDKCLAWNEQSKTFTSFYSYNNVPLMANIGSHLLMWNINTPLNIETESHTSYESSTVWEAVETSLVENVIYNDDNHAIFTINHYIENSDYNTDIVETSAVNNRYSLASIDSTHFVPATIWKKNTASYIKSSWLRTALEPDLYSDWNAHFILSLEFRVNNEPLIIQYDVEGTHKHSSSGFRWESDPLPTIKLRVTSNVTIEQQQLLKFYLGGKHQPTFNSGNITFDGIRAGNYDGNYIGEATQAWNNIDDSFITNINGTDREVVCIVKLYDLNGSVSDNVYTSTNPVHAWLDQGIPFRTSNQRDNKSDVDSSMYQSLIETTTTWEPRTVVNEVTTYSVKSSSSNIWAARELPEYCMFFNNTDDYWITLVCDGMTDKGNAFPADKVFNNIEYRADVFNINHTISDNPHTNYSNSVFNKKHVWNGYQDSQEVVLNDIRKFNTWRVQLPRHHGTRDRIRNPFCYIKLKQDQSVSIQTDRMILHDLAVYFDMK